MSTAPPTLTPPSFTAYTAHDIMLRSKFSASAESFLSSGSSSPSVSEDCACLECEQIYPISRRQPLFRRSLPSLSKLQIPATPLVGLVYLSREIIGLPSTAAARLTFTGHASEAKGTNEFSGVQQALQPRVFLDHGEAFRCPPSPHAN